MPKILVVAALLVGCGDPRAPFVGSYKGTSTELVTWSSYSDTHSQDVSFTLTAPPRSDRLQFSGSCMFTAVVVDADTLQFDPVVCPTEHSTSTGGASADYTTTFTSGTATLTNKTLAITQVGTQLGSHYSDGTPNVTFNIRLNVTATKQ